MSNKSVKTSIVDMPGHPPLGGTTCFTLLPTHPAYYTVRPLSIFAGGLIKSRPVILDKAAPGCYIGVNRNGSLWSVDGRSLTSLQLEESPLPIRWRLFLYVPEDTKDNRCHEQ